jgi:hypothetical protein
VPGHDPVPAAGSRLLPLAALTAVCAGAAVLVVVSQVHALDHDELEHLHSAWYIVTGRVPYRDFFQNHHPLFHYLFAPLVQANGWPTDVLNMRLWLLPFVAGLAACTFGVAKAAGMTRSVGWTAVILLLTMTTLEEAGTEFRPDVPYALCASVACVLFIRALRLNETRALVASGCALATGFLFHQKAIVLLGVLVLVGAWHWRRDRPHRLVWLLVPSLIAAAGLAAWAASTGSLGDYWAMAWRFPALAAGGLSRRVLWKLWTTLTENVGLWLCAIAGLVMAFGSRTAGVGIRATAWLGLLLYVALLGARRPVEQYLLPVIPLATVLAAWTIDTWARRSPAWRLRLAAAVAAVVVVPMANQLGRLAPAHAAQIEQMTFVRALVPPGASVYDGDIQFNVFRDDVHHLWYLVGRGPEMRAYNRLAGPRRAPYDGCRAIRERQPVVVSTVDAVLTACGLADQYREARPGLYVRQRYPAAH